MSGVEDGVAEGACGRERAIFGTETWDIGRGKTECRCGLWILVERFLRLCCGSIVRV